MISIGLLIRAVIAFGFGAIAGTVYYLIRLQKEHQQDLHNLDERLHRLEEEFGQSGTREWDDALLGDLDPSPEYPIRFGKGA
jgi:hypothetical protein